MLSKCVRSNVLRVTVQAAHMSAGVPRVLNVIEGGDKGLMGHTHGPYYTNNMNLADTAGLVSSFDEIVRRAIADDLKLTSTTFDKSEHASVVEYLETVSANVMKFTTTGGVVGRQRERELIMKYFQTKGTMAFICGGPSVGKTRLLDDIIKADTQMRNFKGGAGQSMPVRIVRFDGRAVDSLHKALQQAAVQQEKGVLPLGTVVEVDVGRVKVKMPLTGKSDVAAVTDCVTALWEQAQKDSEHVVVVLDEANAFLKTTNKAADDTVKLFNTLVLHTKQTRHMSVVLMSSDEALPFRLEDMGLKTTHLRHTLVVGGAAPLEMLDQLEELGVGKNLRELLVRIYGGHIWQVDVALDRLASELKAGDETSVVRGPMDSIGDAFALWEEKKGDRERLVGVLEEVARCGFSPL
ncbi:hypothetical protein B484DRAFT_473563, partial [Ochromonadaceae sp. CCMP2298]